MSEKNELYEELRDLRIEVCAQSTLIHSILNVLDELYANGVRSGILESINSASSGSLAANLDEEGKLRIEELNKKIKQYLIINNQ